MLAAKYSQQISVTTKVPKDMATLEGVALLLSHGYGPAIRLMLEQHEKKAGVGPTISKDLCNKNKTAKPKPKTKTDRAKVANTKAPAAPPKEESASVKAKEITASTSSVGRPAPSPHEETAGVPPPEDASMEVEPAVASTSADAKWITPVSKSTKRRATVAFAAEEEPAKAKQNRFAVLDTAQESEPAQQKASSQAKRPPPVILRDAAKWIQAANLFRDKNIAFLKAKSVEDGISIQPSTEDDFRAMTREFDRLGYPYHTYRLQKDKPLSIVIREVPAALDAAKVKSDLILQGFHVAEVMRMHSRKGDKKPLPMVIAKTSRTEQGKKLYELKSVCNLVVKVETKRKSSGAVAQCHRCQRFNHSQSGCKATARCVRCGLAHHTVECKRPTTEPASCANCGGQHPASYKGCSAFPKASQKKQMGKKLQASKSSSEPAKPVIPKATKQTPTSSLATPAKSYVEALVGSKEKGKAIAGKPVLKKTSQKTSVDGQQQQQEKSSFSAIAPLKLLEILGGLNGMRIMAVLQKLLETLKSSNGDFITSLLACLPDIVEIFTKNQ